MRGGPRFGAFLLTGGGLGLFVAMVAGAVGPVDTRYSGAAVLGFLALIGACLGALVGGLIAVLLDRRS